MQISITTADKSDLNAILFLFTETIKNSGHKYYSEKQLAAWAAGANNLPRWQKALQNQYFILAKADEKLLGFASLENNNYIDFLFVHHNYQRQGIAQKLYENIVCQAQNNHAAQITSDVSKIALPFFKTQGFTVLREQTKPINGVEITNYKMVLKLDEK